MKKISILLIVLLLTLALCGTIYAAYKRGFVVVSKTEESVTIKNKKDNTELVVKAKSGKFKVGDDVKYDKKKNKVKPDILEGC